MVSKKNKTGCVTLSPLKGGGDAVTPPPKTPEPNLNSLVGDDVDGAMIAGVAEGVVDVDTEGAAKGKRTPPGAAGRVEGAEKEKAGVEFTTDARGGAGAGVGAGAGAGASGATRGIAATVEATGGTGSDAAAGVNADGANECLKAVPAGDVKSTLESSALLRIPAAYVT